MTEKDAIKYNKDSQLYIMNEENSDEFYEDWKSKVKGVITMAKNALGRFVRHGNILNAPKNLIGFRMLDEYMRTPLPKNGVPIFGTNIVLLPDDDETYQTESSEDDSESDNQSEELGMDINELIPLESEHMFLEFNDPPYPKAAVMVGFHEIEELLEDKLNRIYQLLLERSELKYTYRVGFDVTTGTKVAVQFELDVNKLTGVGDPLLTSNTIDEAKGKTHNIAKLLYADPQRTK